MILTPEERQKFAEWCRREEESNLALAKQLEAIPNNAMVQLAKIKKMQAAGAKIVRDILVGSESQTIGG